MGAKKSTGRHRATKPPAGAARGPGGEKYKSPLLCLAFFPGPQLSLYALIQIHGDAIGDPSAKPTSTGSFFEDIPAMEERPFEVPDHGSLLEVLEEIHRKNQENAVVLVQSLHEQCTLSKKNKL